MRCIQDKFKPGDRVRFHKHIHSKYDPRHLKKGTVGETITVGPFSIKQVFVSLDGASAAWHEYEDSFEKIEDENAPCKCFICNTYEGRLQIGDKVRLVSTGKYVAPIGGYEKIATVLDFRWASWAKYRSVYVDFDDTHQYEEYWEDNLEKVIEGE